MQSSRAILVKMICDWARTLTDGGHMQKEREGLRQKLRRMVEDELRRSFKDNEIWKQMKVLAHETAFIRTG